MALKEVVYFLHFCALNFYNTFNRIMNRFFSIGVCALVSIHSFAFTHIVSYKLYQTVTKEEFRATAQKRHLPKSVVPANYDVDIYDVTYYTKWHDGTTIKATGLYYVPRGFKKPCAELVYQPRHKGKQGQE